MSESYLILGLGMNRTSNGNLLLLLCIIIDTSFAIYDSSFAFLDVSSPGYPIKTYCVNFQQFRIRNLSEKPNSSYTFAWWNNEINETDVCSTSDKNFAGKLVPLAYHTNPLDSKCSKIVNVTKFMNYQLDIAQNHSTSAVLFLVDKGKRNAYGIRDFLFSQFYNPTINDNTSTPSVFYMYSQAFFSDFMNVYSHAKDSIQFQFYRPKSFIFDLSIAIIWLIAFGCVSLGSYWAVLSLKDSDLEAHRQKTFTGLEETSSALAGSIYNQNQTNGVSDETSGWVGWITHCAVVGIAVVFVVSILMLTFFFRPLAVIFFNLFLVVMGTICVYKCVYCLIGFCFKDIELFSLSDLKICCAERELCKKKIRLISSLIFIFALAICVSWFSIRREYFAFFLLDFINICICIYAIKSSQIRSLRFITFLLIAFFIYDIVMVFGTRLLTSNGCSVMLQVVTGMDCVKSTKGDNIYPVAPIDMNFPEKIPILFYVPLLTDPMITCYDVGIETEWRHVMLGLGDVIIPGYLIAYCFFVDAILKKHFRYGLIALIGYGTGLVATFVALKLMNTAQPALIYLVPFTLIPVMIFSCIQKQFSQLWIGQF